MVGFSLRRQVTMITIVYLSGGDEESYDAASISP
jgi:hypothetical protein